MALGKQRGPKWEDDPLNKVNIAVGEANIRKLKGQKRILRDSKFIVIERQGERN